MKTVKVELTIDQWTLGEDIEDSAYLPDVVRSIVDTELDFLVDALMDGLSEYITDEAKELVEREIKSTVTYVKSSISETILEQDKLIDASDHIHELMRGVNEQAVTQ